MADTPEQQHVAPLPEARPVLAPDAAIARDLYCLSCGYNLRGLSGDPVRCPECGYMNPLGDVEIPADIIRRQLTRMEGAPTRCIAAVLLAAAFVPLLVWIAWRAVARNDSPELALCPLTPLVLAALLWTWGARSFRHSCQMKDGWFRVLMLYHWWAFLMFAGSFALAGGIIYAAIRISAHLPSAWTIPIAILWIALVAAGLAVWVPWTYRRATQPLHAMQREVAVEIARERIRRYMVRQTRWTRV